MVVVLAAGAGCFIDPINRAPYVASISPVGPIMKDHEATVKITAHDPDSDSLTVGWAVEPGACRSEAPVARHDGVVVAEGIEVTVDRTMTGGRFCVWGFATDPYGATSVSNNAFDPQNQAPQAKIDVIVPSTADPYQLYSQFILTSDNSSDEDKDLLDYSWSLTNKPAGSTAVLDSTTCQAPSWSAAQHVACFSADKPGQYEVSLTATEAASDGNTPTQNGMVTRVFNVNPDRLPCILTTTPMYSDREIPVLGDHGDALKLEVVTVDDDADPFPAMTPNDLSFTWFLTGPDGHMQTLENDFPSFALGLGNYHIGDLVKVRLQVHDRNREAGDRALLGCGDADLCGDMVSGCFQRVTWNLLWIGG